MVGNHWHTVDLMPKKTFMFYIKLTFFTAIVK